MSATATGCYARSRKGGLTLKQQSAIDLLVSGQNDTQTAAALGLARPTVTKWRLYEPAFQAELQVRRADVWGAGLDRIRSLIPRALEVFADRLEDSCDGYNAALALLRLITLPPLAPTGPTTVDEIVDEMVRERMARQRHLADRGSGAPPLMGPADREWRLMRYEILAELAARANESDEAEGEVPAPMPTPPDAASSTRDVVQEPADWGLGIAAAETLAAASAQDHPVTSAAPAAPATENAPERPLTSVAPAPAAPAADYAPERPLTPEEIEIGRNTPVERHRRHYVPGQGLVYVYGPPDLTYKPAEPQPENRPYPPPPRQP